MSHEQTIANLNDLLERRNEEISHLGTVIDKLESQIRFGVDWMVQEFSRKDPENLPVPRLEYHMVSNSGYSQEHQVSLVVRHLDGQISRVPLTYGKSSGANFDLERFSTTGDMPDEQAYNLPNLVTDLGFFMDSMGLPAYVILDETHRYQLIDNHRPRKLRSIEPPLSSGLDAGV